MKRWTSLLGVRLGPWVAILLTAVPASADDDGVITGADTLEDFTNYLLDTAPQLFGQDCGTALLDYTGPSSSSGDWAMTARQQHVAPMTRQSNSYVCQYNYSFAEAGGVQVAMNPLVVTISADNPQCDSSEGRCRHDAERVCTLNADCVTSNQDAGPCDFSPDLRHSGILTNISGCTPELGCQGSDYPIQGWDDVVSLAWGGQHHNDAVDCNSPVRRALVERIDMLFESCQMGACARISTLLRRGDVSGVTDTFLRLAGLPTMPNPPHSGVCEGVTFEVACFTDQDCIAQGFAGPCGAARPNPFCNGYVYEDNDPIRVPCDEADDTCSNYDSRDRTHGLVQAVFVPNPSVVATVYPITPCDFGQFRLAQPRLLNPGFCAQDRALGCLVDSQCGGNGPCVTERCPDGARAIGGLCFAPTAGNSFECVNSAENRSPLQSQVGS